MRFGGGLQEEEEASGGLGLFDFGIYSGFVEIGVLTWGDRGMGRGIKGSFESL